MDSPLPKPCPMSRLGRHHQETHIFLLGNPYKPSFATHYWEGDNPSDNFEQICPNRSCSISSVVMTMVVTKNMCQKR